MTPNTQATEEELKLITQFGITHEQKTVYFYQGHKYDKLSDAIRYAKISLAHEQTAVSPST